MTSDSIQRSERTRETYRDRAARGRSQVKDARRVERTLAIARLSIFAAGLGGGIVVLFRPLFPPVLLLLPVIAFLALVIVHDRKVRLRKRAERNVDFYERGLARIEFRAEGDDPHATETDLAGIESIGSHPYAADLDILGAGSLFARICVARTRNGRDCLARWLLTPAEPDVIRSRQAAVLELADRLDLREDLAVLGDQAATQVEPGLLHAWASRPPRLESNWPRWVAAALSLITISTLFRWLAGVAPALPFLVGAWASAGWAAWYRRPVQEVLAGVHGPEHDLDLLAHLLRRMEGEDFKTPYLRVLVNSLSERGVPPSQRIRSLQRWVSLADSRRNMIFAPFAALLFVGTQVAFALERWRGESGASVERWVGTIAEFEALSSLAALFTEHPAARMPTILDRGDVPAMRGESLTHPLLEDCVANDVRLGDGLDLVLISGSNMSGKSTWMRTVGINVVLAQAGGPVCATRLAVSPLAVGAAMRVADSLQKGMSHFYAEIQRIRSLVELTKGDRPVLFLLDEVLHGTNSHDRRIGAAGVIRGMLEAGAIGMVTTHDLALAQIADELNPRAVNMHFEDHLEAGEMRFDYKLRAGVVRKSNALELMRSIGLSV